MFTRVKHLLEAMHLAILKNIFDSTTISMSLGMLYYKPNINFYNKQQLHQHLNIFIILHLSMSIRTYWHLFSHSLVINLHCRFFVRAVLPQEFSASVVPQQSTNPSSSQNVFVRFVIFWFAVGQNGKIMIRCGHY